MLPTDLEPMGVLVLQEQIRPDARATLARFADAGVTLKLISGDNPVTVAALARQVGLSLDGEAISGLELQQMDDARPGRGGPHPLGLRTGAAVAQGASRRDPPGERRMGGHGR